jgi:hypothetical protein
VLDAFSQQPGHSIAKSAKHKFRRMHASPETFPRSDLGIDDVCDSHTYVEHTRGRPARKGVA